MIQDGTMSAIALSVPPGVGTFLLTSETTVHGIVDHWRRARTSTIQIVDYIEEVSYGIIRSQIPWVKLVQVVRVEDESAVSLAGRLSEYVDALLLDSGHQGAPTKILGGTGKTHDWGISREVVTNSLVPVFLAGGITPVNVRSAVEQVHPYGIDVCTGVRTEGKLDPGKLHDLFKEVAAAQC